MREVTVRQHDDGTWYTRIYQGTDPVTKKKQRKYRRFPDASCEEEALAMAREWAASLPAGGVESARLADVLNRYVAVLPGMGRSANTCKSYAGIARRYVAPYIGNVDVDELQPRHVEGLYTELMKRGLAPTTVNQVHWFLRGAYKWIVKNELAPFNPMLAVSRRQAPKHEVAAMGDDESDALGRKLAAIALGEEDAPRECGTDPMFARMAAVAACISLWTGMRCGECCALLCRDFSPSANILHVAGTVVEPKGLGARYQYYTKGKRSRNVAVPLRLFDVLEPHMRWRLSFLGPAGKRRGHMGKPICCAPDGGFLRPSKVSKWFSVLSRSMGLEGVTFHTLRHIHATSLLRAGVDMRTVQERLGHADVSTTLRTYAHVLPGRDREAADALDVTVPKQCQTDSSSCEQPQPGGPISECENVSDADAASADNN